MIGGREEACNLAVYSPDLPEAYFSANPNFSQWIREEDIREKGAALLWEGNGFLLLYKRYEGGSLSWPRTPEEAAMITKGEYRLLLQGFNPLRKRISMVEPQTAL